MTMTINEFIDRLHFDNENTQYFIANEMGQCINTIDADPNTAALPDRWAIKNLMDEMNHDGNMPKPARTVTEYFEHVFRDTMSTDAYDFVMKVNTPCGRECVATIRAAKSFYRMANPEQRPMILEMARRAVETKMFG